jgi:cytochrome c551/c552
LLYALTDHSDGVLLRIEPATAAGVANRYAMTDANIALLAGKIIEGSEGVWGETPMAPHPAIARDTAEQMVRAILGLATQ